MFRRLSRIVSVFGILVCCVAISRAEIFTAYLTPAQEVPPAAGSTATGYARIFLNETAGTIQYTVVFNGLTSAQSGAHIHAPAPIGTNASVMIGFATIGGTSGTLTGSSPITPTQIAQLRAHQAYVNVHSTNFPGGEIRGQLGSARPLDYDGDGRTDYSTLRFPNIAPPGVSPIDWWTLSSTAGILPVIQWGDANRDFPAPGDYDGDAKNDVALYRSGATDVSQSEFWIVRSSDNQIQYYAWGLGSDLPVARDYDGDGITDVATFRPGVLSSDPVRWFILQSATNTVRIAFFGLTGDGTNSFDTPVPADYDGDGKFDIAVYRFGLSPANNFIVLQSSNGQVTWRQFGNFNTDWIVPGDYDGDGKADYAVARTGATGSSPMVWWYLQSSDGQSRTRTFGISSDFPTQGDYDGDARTDLAIWRQGATTGAQSNYWVLRSFDGASQVVPWGNRESFSVNRFDSR